MTKPIGATKRITVPVDRYIDTIKQHLEEELGIAMSYAQVIQYLIKFYRKNKDVKSVWRM